MPFGHKRIDKCYFSHFLFWYNVDCTSYLFIY